MGNRKRQSRNRRRKSRTQTQTKTQKQIQRTKPQASTTVVAQYIQENQSEQVARNQGQEEKKQQKQLEEATLNTNANTVLITNDTIASKDSRTETTDATLSQSSENSNIGNSKLGCNETDNIEIYNSSVEKSNSDSENEHLLSITTSPANNQINIDNSSDEDITTREEQGHEQEGESDKTISSISEQDDYLIDEQRRLGISDSLPNVSLAWWCDDVHQNFMQKRLREQYRRQRQRQQQQSKRNAHDIVVGIKSQSIRSNDGDDDELVDILRRQLDRSNGACKELLDIVKEQELLIEELRKANAAVVTNINATATAS